MIFNRSEQHLKEYTWKLAIYPRSIHDLLRRIFRAPRFLPLQSKLNACCHAIHALSNPRIPFHFLIPHPLGSNKLFSLPDSTLRTCYVSHPKCPGSSACRRSPPAPLPNPYCGQDNSKNALPSSILSLSPRRSRVTLTNLPKGPTGPNSKSSQKGVFPANSYVGKCGEQRGICRNTTHPSPERIPFALPRHRGQAGKK
jgi:hypothetical protein